MRSSQVNDWAAARCTLSYLLRHKTNTHTSGLADVNSAQKWFNADHLHCTCTGGMHQCICYLSRLQQHPSVRVHSPAPHHSLPGLAPFITSQPRASCFYIIPTPAVALSSGSTIILNSWYLNLSKKHNFNFLRLTVFLLDFYFLTIIILIITCKRTTCRGCFRPSSVSTAIQLYRLNSYGLC